MKINRIWAMPDKNTFKILPIESLILRVLESLPEKAVVVDAFANDNTIKSISLRGDLKYITNDLNPNFHTDYHLDATDFMQKLSDQCADFVLYDPPFSPRQVAECYKEFGQTVNMETTQASYWANQKAEIGRIVKPNGLVLTCSWNSGGIGEKYGFEPQEILLVPHGGWHNDTIVVLEKRVVSPQLTLF